MILDGYFVFGAVMFIGLFFIIRSLKVSFCKKGHILKTLSEHEDETMDKSPLPES